MTTDDDMDDLLAAYALDAVSDDERAAIEAMLADRPDMVAEVDGHRAAAALLAEGVAQDPPPGLRSEVLAAVADAAQDQPIVPLEPVGRGWRPALVALAAAVVLVAGFALVLLVVGDAGSTDPIADVLTDPDATVVELDGAVAETLRVVYSDDADASVLEGVGVDATGADMTYQLWLIADGTPMPAALFTPDGSGTVLVRVDGLDPTGGVVAVTAEPSGGSVEPTPPILARST